MQASLILIGLRCRLNLHSRHSDRIHPDQKRKAFEAEDRRAE